MIYGVLEVQSFTQHLKVEPGYFEKFEKVLFLKIFENILKNLEKRENFFEKFGISFEIFGKFLLKYLENFF